MEIQETNILWDFNIRTHRVVKARSTEILLIDKKNQEAFIIDVLYLKIFVSGKISKYQNLALEISQMWNTKTRVILIVIGGLGAECLALIGVKTMKGATMQQTAVLESAHILRKVPSISA